MRFLYILFGFFLLVVTSCTPTKKIVPAQKEAVVEKKPDIVINKTNNVKVDTMSLQDKSKTIIPPPISTIEKSSSSVISSKSIALILPFKSDLYDVSVDENLWALQYYAGVKLAAKKLEKEGINLDIKVFDSDNFNMGDLNPQFDMIIGPYATTARDENRTLFQNILDYGKKNKVLVVSPFYSNSKTTENNPYYLQLKPNLREYLSRIVEHISKNYAPEDVAIILRDGSIDDRWNEYLQQQSEGFYNKKSNQLLDVLKVNPNMISGSSSIFKGSVDKGKKVFILPNYSFQDEVFVSQILNKLNNEKGSQDIVVYGMPLLLDSEKVGVSLYNALQIRLVVPDFLERNTERARSFSSNFFYDYKTSPSKHAFEGYDMMLFLGRGISTFGKDFPKRSSKDNSQFLQTNYSIQAVYEDGDDSFTKLLFYENKHLDIIGFTNGRFRKI